MGAEQRFRIVFARRVALQMRNDRVLIQIFEDSTMTAREGENVSLLLDVGRHVLLEVEELSDLHTRGSVGLRGDEQIGAGRGPLWGEGDVYTRTIPPITNRESPFRMDFHGS